MKYEIECYSSAKKIGVSLNKPKQETNAKKHILSVYIYNDAGQFRQQSSLVTVEKNR